MKPVVKIGTKLTVGTVTAITKSGVIVDGKLFSFHQIEEMVNDQGIPV